MTPVVAVGIGNTTVAMGLTNSPNAWPPPWTASQDQETTSFDPAAWVPLLPQQPAAWHVASVQRAAEQRLAAWVSKSRPEDTYRRLRRQDARLPVDVRYPDRVGMDRLMAAVAVNRLRDPARAAVIVDAGTATTIDLVEKHGAFMGGVILSGLRITARALATFTDQLPEVDCTFVEQSPPPIGRSTEEAIRSGLFYGGLGAIRECVEQIGRTLPDPPQIFVTGGAAERLVHATGLEHQYVPDLVLAGIVLAAQDPLA